MFTSEAVTRGVRVYVESQFDPDRSEPSRGQWFFLYTIRITNEGTETVQLLTRHWIITHPQTGRIVRLHLRVPVDDGVRGDGGDVPDGVGER
jgi:uncharacterized protein affecting Mg2+/Co2+ transport